MLTKLSKAKSYSMYKNMSSTNKHVCARAPFTTCTPEERWAYAHSRLARATQATMHNAAGILARYKTLKDALADHVVHNDIAGMCQLLATPPGLHAAILSALVVPGQLRRHTKGQRLGGGGRGKGARGRGERVARCPGKKSGGRKRKRESLLACKIQKRKLVKI